MRENFQEIEINEETYRLRKMDALSGSALLKLLLEKFLPVVQTAESYFNGNAGTKKKKTEKEMNEEATQLIVKMLPPLLANISEDEWTNLMSRALQYVDKKMKAGWVQVMDKHRNFQVEDAEYDISLCVNLAVRVIIYNCSGFFGENGLSLMSVSQNTSLPKP